MTKYEYCELPAAEIRTLLLQPSLGANPDALIHIEIKHRRLDEAPVYEALSYTWGDTSVLHEICCDGRTLQITANLKAALQTLRSVDTPREMWVDAICINQSNDVEKQAQIRVMRQIFSTAVKTIVWLGNESDDVATAISFFKYQERRMTEVLAGYMNVRRAAPEDMSSFLGDTFRAFGSSHDFLFMGFDQQRTQRAIAKFLTRPWFRRAWTVQEFVFSKEIEMRCGSLICTDSFAIPNFEYSFNQAQLSWHGSIDPVCRQDMFRGMAQMLQLQFHRTSYITDNEAGLFLDFLTALRKYRASETTKPEDKIWAFQALARTATVSSRLSSWAGMTTRDLFIALAKSYLDESGPSGIGILSEASRSFRLNYNMPSWVPDWSESPTAISLANLVRGKSDWFFAAGGHPTVEPGPCFRIAGDVLHLAGSIIADIFHIGFHWPDRITNAPNLSSVISAFHSTNAFKEAWPRPTYFNGEDMQDVQIATLSVGQVASTNGFILDMGEASWLDPLGDLEVDVSTSCVTTGEDEAIVKLFAEDVQLGPENGRNFARAAAGRRAVVCNSMEKRRFYIGMAPVATEVGDKICILRSCAVPLVLRLLENGRYKLIGDCYIHGVMEGQIVDELTWEDIEIQ